MIRLYNSINILFNGIEFLIFIRIILSFLNIDPYSTLGKFVYSMTDPILAPARELIYKLGINTGMFDFSPLLAILILRIISSLLANILF